MYHIVVACQVEVEFVNLMMFWAPGPLHGVIMVSRGNPFAAANAKCPGRIECSECTEHMKIMKIKIMLWNLKMLKC